MRPVAARTLRVRVRVGVRGRVRVRVRARDEEDHPRVRVERAVEGDGTLGALDSEGEVAPLGPVLDDHAELLRAQVLLHVPA